MKKRLLCLALTASMTAMCLSGCGGNGNGETETAGETESETKATVYASDYDLEKYIKLGDYKALEYVQEDTTVTDEEVETQIQSTLQSNATYEQITDRAVADGDTVNIDYTGTMDGEEFSGGSAAGAALTIGSGSFIAGFEEGLIDATPGEEVTIDLTFPDEYKPNPDYAGKAASFAVKVNYIQGEQITPELTDEFVAGLAIDNVTTVDEYRAYVKTSLETTKKSNAETTMQSTLLTAAVDNAELLETPDDLVAQEYKNLRAYYEQYATYFGADFATFLSSYMNMTEEEFEKQGQEVALNRAKQSLVIYAIAAAEGFEVTDAVYEEKANNYVEQMGLADIAELETNYEKGAIIDSIMYEHVIQILTDNAVAVEASETETETAAETAAE